MGRAGLASHATISSEHGIYCRKVRSISYSQSVQYKYLMVTAVHHIGSHLHTLHRASGIQAISSEQGNPCKRIALFLQHEPSLSFRPLWQQARPGNHESRRFLRRALWLRTDIGPRKLKLHTVSGDLDATQSLGVHSYACG